MYLYRIDELSSRRRRANGSQQQRDDGGNVRNLLFSQTHTHTHLILGENSGLVAEESAAHSAAYQCRNEQLLERNDAGEQRAANDVYACWPHLRARARVHLLLWSELIVSGVAHAWLGRHTSNKNGVHSRACRSLAFEMPLQNYYFNEAIVCGVPANCSL